MEPKISVLVSAVGGRVSGTWVAGSILELEAEVHGGERKPRSL